MKTSENKQKLFTYWRARYLTEPFSKTLQEILTTGLDKTTIKDRLVNPTENYRQFINYKTTIKGIFCAGVLSYEEGSIGQVISSRLDQDSIAPEALPPQKASDGSAREFLDGKLYFICKGNHMVLVQDLHMKARHLESYLNKILLERPNSLPENQAIILERSIPRDTKKKMDRVAGMKLSGAMHYESKKIPDSHGKAEIRSIPTGTMWDAIKNILPESYSKRLSTEGITDPKQIDVSIQLKWKRKKRIEKVSDEIDSLANAFRHIDDELDFEAITTSGAVLKKDELRLQKLVSVRHKDGIPEQDDLFEKMINWYSELNIASSI